MKSKKSKKELTSLILTALILGGGSLYGPVAEASDASIIDNGETVAALVLCPRTAHSLCRNLLTTFAA